MKVETERTYPGPDPDFDRMSVDEMRTFIVEADEQIVFARDHGAEELFIIGLCDQRNRAQAELGRRNGKPDDAETTELSLSPDALQGLAGEIVRTIEPFTEADPAALLVNALAAFGNVTGCSAHATVQNDEHPGRLFIAQVGATSKGRKGTGWSPIKHLFSLIDSAWSKERIKTGLSTGEGLIFNVRDPIYKQEPIKEKGRVIDYQEVMTDPGESDKRLLVIEPEFASTLTVMAREGNILSAVIRQAWDDGNLSPLTRNNPIKSTGAHITFNHAYHAA